MAHDVSTGIITAAVSIYDVQYVIGTNECDLASLCAHENINPMAKYKPIRYNKIAALTDSERQGTRYGMSEVIPTFATSQASPSVTWVYNKVRAGTDVARLTDFENYYHRACVPFAFSVSGALGDGIGFAIYVNASAGNYYFENEGAVFGWDNNKNLSINDLLFANSPSVTNLSNCYMTFVVHDITAGGNPLILVFNQKLSDVMATVPTLYAVANGMTSGGLTYPQVPFLQGYGRNGHTFRIIACLSQNYNGGSANAYEVIDPSSSTYAARTVYSLAIKAGADRKEMVMNNRLTIAGLNFRLITSGVTMTKVEEETVGGLLYYKYNVVITAITGEFVIPSNWPFKSGEYIYVYTTIRTDYGTIGNSPTTGENKEYDTTVSLPTTGQQTVYNRTLVGSTSFTAYFYKDATKSIEISAFASTFHDYGLTERKDSNVYIVTP